MYGKLSYFEVSVVLYAKMGYKTGWSFVRTDYPCVSAFQFFGVDAKPLEAVLELVIKFCPEVYINIASRISEFHYS